MGNARATATNYFSYIPWTFSLISKKQKSRFGCVLDIVVSNDEMIEYDWVCGATCATSLNVTMGRYKTDKLVMRRWRV